MAQSGGSSASFSSSKTTHRTPTQYRDQGLSYIDKLNQQSSALSPMSWDQAGQQIGPAPEFTPVAPQYYQTIPQQQQNELLSNMWAQQHAGAQGDIRGATAQPGTTTTNPYGSAYQRNQERGQRAYASGSGIEAQMRGQWAGQNAQQGLAASGLQAQIEQQMAQQNVERANAMSGMRGTDIQGQQGLLALLGALYQPQPFSKSSSGSTSAWS